MKFRHHRGSLEESMETIQEVQSLNDVKSVLEGTREGLNFSVGHLTCKHYSYDSRIHWDTWIVCEDGAAIGFSDGELK